MLLSSMQIALVVILPFQDMANVSLTVGDDPNPVNNKACLLQLEFQAGSERTLRCELAGRYVALVGPRIYLFHVQVFPIGERP